MSRTVKTAVIVSVVVVVVVGLWWFMRSQNAYAPGTATDVPPAPEIGITPPVPQNPSGASIEQDMASIDAQLNALGSDSAAVDESLSDTPVKQENL
ncbi:MAG: hypothetical protein Q7S84_03100 [bacterium]|nr:hypothetical protein [bacterium]